MRKIFIVLICFGLIAEGSFLAYQKFFFQGNTEVPALAKNNLTPATTVVASTTSVVANSATATAVGSTSAVTFHPTVPTSTSVEHVATATVVSIKTIMTPQVSSVSDQNDFTAEYRQAWMGMLNAMNAYNKTHTISYYTLGETRALANTAVEIVVLTNELLKNKFGAYLTEIPPMAFGQEEAGQKDDNLMLPQFLYFPIGKTSYELCYYSLIDGAKVVPTCFSNTEAVAMLTSKNKTTVNLYSAETLRNYGSRLGQYLVTDTTLGTTKDSHITFDAYDYAGGKTFNAYSAHRMDYFNNFKTFLDTTVSNSVIFGDAEATAQKKKKWIDEFERYMIPSLLVAYKLEYKSYPKTLVDILPTGYVMPGTYTLAADASDFTLCESIPGLGIETTEECIHQVDAMKRFVSLLQPTLISNSTVISAMENSTQIMYRSVYEDINLQLGLILLSQQMNGFKKKYNREPKTIDEFISEYKDVYQPLIANGTLVMSGQYNEQTQSFVITYTVKDRGTFQFGK